MSRRVSVHHFVANNTTRRYGPGNRTSDLLGVDYQQDVPADAEFPRMLARMDLFTRFYLDRAKPADFFVRVWWNDHPGGEAELVGSHGPFHVDFRAGVPVHDAVFRINMMQLQGTGRHTVQLLRERKRGWRAGELVSIAMTHFFVER